MFARSPKDKFRTAYIKVKPLFLIIIAAGIPFGKVGGTNMMMVRVL